MSWKASLSRHLPALRFFGCPNSPSSRGILNWYKNNYHELKMLNPTMPLMFRTAENAMPAITTEIDFETDDLLKFMIQTQKFKNANGTIADDRVDAAKDYLQTDWASIRRERWASPGFDPCRPFLEKIHPDWRDDPKISEDLGLYLSLKDTSDKQMDVIKSGPDNEYTRAENALLMCQRVDLWCAGPKEVESAVQHLLKLGERFNDLEPDYPEYITEFYPGASDL